MLDATRNAVKAICAADPTLSAAMVDAALVTLQGKDVTVYVDPAPMDRVIPRKVAAQILGVTPRCISLYARRGLVRPIRLGAAGSRSIGYSEESIRKVLAGTAAK